MTLLRFDLHDLVVDLIATRARGDLTPSASDEPSVRGETILYRLFDVGYEIRLDQAFGLLSPNGPERPRPIRGEAHAIQIQNPPVTVSLGSESVVINGRDQVVEYSASIFEFGVVSIRVCLPAPPGGWEAFIAFGIAAATSPAWGLIEGHRDRLLQRIRPCVERFEVSSVTEEYIIHRLHFVGTNVGPSLPLQMLHEEGMARLLLGEARPLAVSAQRESLSQRFSYFDDDLTVVTWNAALVVETVPEDRDVQYVLEFANAQLLEMRYYDSILDSELPRTYQEIAAARGRFRFLGRRYSRLLSLLQTRVADAIEAIERVENSFRVTDDVFLARIYGASMDIFRGPTWRRGIDRKVSIIRDAYTMLNAEAQTRRTEVMELTIILLIAVEILLALVRA